MKKSKIKQNKVLPFYNKVEGLFQSLHGIQMNEKNIRNQMQEYIEEDELNSFFKNLERANDSLQYCANDLYHISDRVDDEIREEIVKEELPMM